MKQYVRRKYVGYFNDDYYDYTLCYVENAGWLADGEYIKYDKFELDFTREIYDKTIHL